MIGLSNVISVKQQIFNHFLFGTHVSPQIVGDENNDEFLIVLRNTYSDYPTNSYYHQLQQFIHLGLSPHAPHHTCSFIPRSLLHIAAKELKDSYPDDCREIKSLSEEMSAYWNRVVYGFPSDIPDGKF